ncbi:MAG: biotin--[acetyl-CoA-carboxylase] ligase [Gammaproteobacteria bacterium]|nr:biotin--[acetyl-CoA-carboxylase] ligase [Gammaproteobacteria bacterium]
MHYDFQKIARLLPKNGKFSADRIVFFDEVDSTNVWMLKQPEIDGLCCITSHQVEGKGRQGRKWSDVRGGSILMSMGWEVDAGHCPGVSLVAGLAVIKSLKEQGIKGVQLKWPNDILFDAGKLGGILVEKTGTSMVVGLGLNYRLKDSSMSGIEQPWTDIASISATCDADELLSAILRNMGEMITDCIARGFKGYADYWNSLDAFRGCLTEVRMGQETIVGVEQGVNETGALLIESGEGVQTIHTGDVSLRRRAFTQG